MRIGILGPIATDSVAHLLHPLPDGAPRGTTSAPMLGTLISALVERGHEVAAFTLVYAETLPQPIVRLAGERFTLHFCQGREHSIRWNRGRPGRAVDAFGAERMHLLAALRGQPLDVLHAHWFYEYAAAALDQAAVPVVVSGHDDPWRVLRHMPSLYRFSRFLLARTVMRRSTVTTAVSPYLAQRVAGFSGRAVTVVANPLPAALLEGPPARPGDHPSAGARIGMVLNGWSGLKNATTALRAFARLRAQRPDVVLEVFGTDYEPGGPAQRWARRCACAGGVSFVGELPQPELLRRMAGLDALLHPSVEESFGLVLAEAMALGVPVLGGNRSGAVSWLLEEGHSGALVDVRDEAAIATALAGLLDGGHVVRERVIRARARVQALCAPEVVAQAYEAVYRRAVSARPAATSMRVLHVLNELMPSGAEVMLRAAAQQWAVHGAQCQLLALGPQPGPYAPVLRESGYEIHHLPFEPSRRFVRDFQALLRAQGIDVVHLHVERASMWLALAARLAGVQRLVRTVHGNFMFDGWLRRRRVLSRAATRLLGARQITISEGVSATERERFGNHNRVIHNWYDSARIAPPDPERRTAARARLGVEPDQSLIISIGNCSAVKNHAALIEALARLERRDWCYLHIGCEEAGEPERALAARLGVAAQIRFLGLQREVHEFLCAADLFVMPSLREGLGVAALEAIGAGVPALLGDVPGLHDLKAHFGSVLFSPVDADGLAGGLHAALRCDRSAWRAAAAHDAIVARERFGMERGVAAYVSAYAAPTDGGAPPHAAATV